MKHANQKFFFKVFFVTLFFRLFWSAQIVCCQADTAFHVAPFFEPQKYQGVVTQTIDKYILLCAQLEHIVGAGELNFNLLRQLVFTHACVINCYNDMIAKKSVQPIIVLWDAYKKGVITLDKQKFVYELCHLIGIVFEQFLIKLAADLTGQSAQTMTDLLDKLQIDLPLDDLIDILEQCYHELSLIADQLSIHYKITWNKKTVIVVLALVAFIGKLCQYYAKHRVKQVCPVIIP